MRLSIEFDPNLLSSDEDIICQGLLTHNVEELGFMKNEKIDNHSKGGARALTVSYH